MNIAFSGWAQSGKTTAAEYCEDMYGHLLLSFADKIKMNLMDIGVDSERLFGTKDKSVRKLMQIYGQVMREQNEDNWLTHLTDIMDTDFEGIDTFAIDDLRYLNEAEALRKRGFLIVRLVRIGHDPDVPHISESALDDYNFDYIIRAVSGDTGAICAAIDHILGGTNELAASLDS